MKEILQASMRYALSLGADYADIRAKDIRMENIQVENGVLANAANDRSQGYGIRVYNDGSMGFAASNDFEGINGAVKQAYDISVASKKLNKKNVVLDNKKPVESQYKTPVEINPFSVSLEEKLALLMECDAIMRAAEGVSKTYAMLDFRLDDVIFADTDGSYIEQEFMQSAGWITASAFSDSDMQRRNYFNVLRSGYEGILDLNLKENAARIAKECVDLLKAQDCPSGIFDIILTPRQLMLQIHESVGHPTELDRVFGSEAAFAGRSFVSVDYLKNPFTYGSEHVTIVADAASPLGLGTFAYDDEGVPGQCIVLVDKGKFTGFQSSRENAPLIGQDSHGMGLADGWRNLPIVRMTNINLLPGNFTLDELIAGIKDGFLFDENKSWSIDDLRINFQFACEIAYEIKNGRLTGKVFKNPIYSGKTTEFWGNCDGVCNKDFWQIVGVHNCGKGQPVQVMRVAHGSAPARFKKVKVGVADVK